MSLEEAYEIVDAYFTGRFKSIYLLDAWNTILKHLKNEGKNE